MAHGKPVIGSDVEGPIDIIEDGVKGFIFKRGDKEALTSSILNLLNNS